MIGLIMAAGKGSRINSLTNGMPKCFLELGGIKLIDHQINALKTYELEDILNLFKLQYNFVEADLKKAYRIALKLHPDKILDYLNINIILLE